VTLDHYNVKDVLERSSVTPGDIVELQAQSRHGGTREMVLGLRAMSYAAIAVALLATWIVPDILGVSATTFAVAAVGIALTVAVSAWGAAILQRGIFATDLMLELYERQVAASIDIAQRAESRNTQ
jgi:hypothetical protein